MTSPAKLEGDNHRMRARAAGASGRERDALHALLAIASAAQQERGQPAPQPEPDASAGAGETPAPPPPAGQGVLQRMAESTCALTQATGAAIAVARGAAMVCVASTGKCAIEVGACVELDRGLAGRCARTGEVQECPDAEHDDRVNQQACRELGVRSLVMVPVRRRRQAVVGVLSVLSDEPAHFSSRHLRFLEFMAGLVLEATEHGRQETSAAPTPPFAPPQAAAREAEPPAVARTRSSRLRIAGAVSLLALVVAAMAWLGWPQIQSRLRPKPSPPPTALPTPEAAAPVLPQLPAESQAAPAVAAQPQAQALPLASPDGRAQLTAVSYSSVPGGTRVVLELDRAVEVHAGRLAAPPRLFFDLDNTHLALAGRSFPADDALLRSIRVAQYQQDVARVVLDLKAPADYSAALESAPPRLVIDLRAVAPPR